jgi:hypothetical protein
MLAMLTYSFRGRRRLRNSPEGNANKSVKTAQAAHRLVAVMSTTYRYTKNGRTQICGIMAVKAISFQISERYVMASIVHIVRNVVGTVSKFVTTTLKPSSRKVRVMYWFTGTMPIWNVRPRT